MGQHSDFAQSLINDLESRRRQLDAKRRHQEQRTVSPTVKRLAAEGEKYLALAEKHKAKNPHMAGLIARSALSRLERAQATLSGKRTPNHSAPLEIATGHERIKR